MIPDFLKKLLGKGGDVADAAPKPGLESLASPMDVGITPKPTVAAPFPETYANPMESMTPITPPAPAIPALLNDPRMAGRTIQDEFKQRQTDPNQEVVFREPFGAQKYDYVTNGGTELPHRSWKEALKNIATGAMVGIANGQGIGGAIGGAAAGGIGGAINPTMGKEMRFNSFQLPKLVQNRDYQNQQALNQAKIGAENAKAQHDSLFHAGDAVLDTRTGQVVYQKPPGDYTLAPGAIRASGSNNAIIRKNEPKAQVDKRLVVENGQPVYRDVNLPQNANLPAFVNQAKAQDITPYQKLQEEHRDQDAADKVAAQEQQANAAVAAFEAAKTAAMQKGITGDKLKDDPAVQEAFNYLIQNYPDRFEAGYGAHQAPYVKPKAGYQAPVPARLRNKASGRTISPTTAQDLLNR